MNNRNASIDTLKGLLILGMIFSHTIDLFADKNSFFFTQQFTLYSSCITYSGFLFCFGYVTKFAYLSKDFKQIRFKLLINAGKTYLAYLISGLCYQFFIAKMDLSLKNVAKIALFFNLPILSEYIISFTIFSLFTFITFRPLKWLISDKKRFWVSITLLLLTTFIPADLAPNNQTGLLIGSSKFGSFPLLQYLPIFLLGLYFAEYKIVFNLKLLIGALICTSIAIAFWLVTRHLPVRFPPSLAWVIAPLFFIYCYYLTAQLIHVDALRFIGRNVLFYSLVSNLILFSISGATDFSVYPDPLGLKSLLTAAILTLLITYLLRLQPKPITQSQRE